MKTLSQRSRRLVWAIAAVLVGAVFLFPLVAMLSGSLRLPGLAPPRSFEAIPSPISAEAYRRAFDLAPLGRSLLNSSIVAALYVPLAVLTASLAGFAISQLAGRARTRLTAVVLILMMVPATALWIPRFAIFEALGLVGTWIPLILPALTGGNPFFVLLYAFAFTRIPKDVFDAARIEGAGLLTIWRAVAMPLARGTTVAVGMLAFIQSWANFIDPLLYLNSERSFTAPLALRYLEQLGRTNHSVLLAASVAVTAPVVLVFVLAQRSFLREERGIGWLGR